MNKKIFVLFILLGQLLSFGLTAQQSDSVKTIPQKKDTLKEKSFFELSFGQSMLFISNSKIVNIRNNSAVVIPTSAMLFFVEFRPLRRVRIPVFFNLPLETKQFLVNNVLINERASPTFGFGLEFKAFQVKIDEESKLEFEAGPLASFLMDTKDHVKFAPIAAARVRLIRNHNFVMYMGTSYSFGINSWGLLYGTGTVF